MTPFTRFVLPKTALNACVVVLALMVLPEVIGAEWRSLGPFTAFWALAIIGLDITWGLAGRASLGHQGFVAVGAYATAVASVKWGLNPWLAMLVAVGTAAAIAVLIGRIVLRLEAVYLALATLAFGFMVPHVAQSADYFGRATGIFGLPSLELGFEVTRSDWYWFGWVFVAVGVVVAVRFARSMTGLGWRIIAENELTAESFGVATRREKEKAFTVAAIYAAVAGALYAHFNTAIAPTTFNTQLLLIFVFALIVGGRGTVMGPVVGVILTMAGIIYAGRQDGSADVLLGVGFILALLAMSRGLAGSASAALRAVVAHRRCVETPVVADGAPARPRELSPIATLPQLGQGLPARGTGGSVQPVEISDVSKSFGGLVALSAVTVTFEPGTVHGIVGPNGAGKSTLLAVASGAYRADTGRVRCFGRDVTRWPGWRRARCGMARTFQTPQLAENLSILENVAVGMYPVVHAGLMRSLTPFEGFRLRHARAAAEEALDLFGLSQVGQAMPSDLSFGQMRLVELARALVRSPSILWLDEPASGLDQNEKQLLSTIVREYAAGGAVVGFIEHDTELVAATCDVATVLDTGQVVHQGPAGSVFEVDVVRELYMGSDEAEAGAVLESTTPGAR